MRVDDLPCLNVGLLHYAPMETIRKPAKTPPPFNGGDRTQLGKSFQKNILFRGVGRGFLADSILVSQHLNSLLPFTLLANRCMNAQQIEALWLSFLGDCAADDASQRIRNVSG